MARRRIRQALAHRLLALADRLLPDNPAARVMPPREMGHPGWTTHLPSLFNQPGRRVLEVGSRNVTGTNLRSAFDRAEYVGFDFYAGENVDVVGDAHRLASYFAPGTRFDLIFCSAVFEHLHMPWIVAQQMHALLPVGGHVFVETHFSYIAHELPWNFFQFSDAGLRALFNRALGFEVVDSGMSNPMLGVFSSQAAPYLRHQAVRGLYCHSAILCRKVAEAPGFEWSGVAMDDVVDGTRYPQPKAGAA